MGRAAPRLYQATGEKYLTSLPCPASTFHWPRLSQGTPQWSIPASRLVRAIDNASRSRKRYLRRKSCQTVMLSRFCEASVRRLLKAHDVWNQSVCAASVNAAILVDMQSSHRCFAPLSMTARREFYGSRPSREVLIARRALSARVNSIAIPFTCPESPRP